MKTIAKKWVRALPVYEPGKPVEELARELGCASPDDIDKLASNENPLGPSPLALEAAKKAAERMHVYPDGGAYYLRNAIAAKLEVKPGQVLAANGSNEALELLGHVFLEPGTDAVLGEQAFLVYALVAAMFRARVIAVPMLDYTHDLDAMLAAVTPQTKIVFVANPNNPTGTMVGDEAIGLFMDKVPEHVAVCFDEAYIEFLEEDRRPDTLKYVREGRNVVVLRTFSKSHGLAGLRIGYAVAREETISLFQRVRQPFSVNSIAQGAALAALDDEDHVRRTRELVATEYAFLTENLLRLGLPFVPSAANFVLVDVGCGREIFQAMQQERVIVRSMDAYGLPRHVRITIGLRSENERCIKALEKVVGAFRK